jgi:hypothetical protein
VDEAALFSFDTELKEVRPFSTTFETADHGVRSRAWRHVGGRDCRDRESPRSAAPASDGRGHRWRGPASRMKPKRCRGLLAGRSSTWW